MPLYEEENEDQQMLLWPLYFTSFLIDDFLDDESMFGTKTAVLPAPRAAPPRRSPICSHGATESKWSA